jgi:hypothetical protein
MQQDFLFLLPQFLLIGPASASKPSHRRGPPTTAGLPTTRSPSLQYTLLHGFSYDPSVFDCFKFLAPSLILNPVLLLHSGIAMFTYLLTRLEGYDQTSTYVRPHLDHENLCWLYSVFIVFEQIITFQRYDRFKGNMEDERTSVARGFSHEC